MTNEEKLHILRRFAKIRNMQPTDGARNPVFWTIQTEITEITEDPNETDYYEIVIHHKYYNDATYTDDTKKECAAYINRLLKTINDGPDKADVEKQLNEAKNVADIAKTINELIWILNPAITCTLTGYKVEYVTISDLMFLTKKEAINYLKKYRYRYKNPKIYANTALDCENGMTGKIFDILADCDFWDSICFNNNKQEEEPEIEIRNTIVTRKDLKNKNVAY